jgi:hypothetical protein
MIEESKQLYVMVNKFVMKLGNLVQLLLYIQVLDARRISVYYVVK